MPRIKKNSLVKGASGNYRREFVYKNRGDKTFFGGMPELDPKRTRTPREKAFKQKSISATAYAQAVIADPVLKAFYQKKVSNGNTAYNLAFKDYQTMPYVDIIDTGKYTGVPGSTIVVEAFDAFEVTDVIIRITSAAGVLIEEGPAIVNKLEGAKWFYTATQNNPVLPGTKIKATCKDRPKHEAFKEVIL
jgi:hypothetical protein